MTGRGETRWAIALLALATIAAGCASGARSDDPTAGSPRTSASSGASPDTILGPSPTPTAPTPNPSVDLIAAREAFEYPAGERAFVLVDETTTDGVTVRDVTYESAEGRMVSALLVLPDTADPSPAVLYLHWYAPNESDGNRTEFLDEAVALAADGVVSLLPQQVFPWTTPPAGAEADRQAVIDQVVDVRMGLDILVEQPSVDPDRLVVVGHDFGGMYAALVAGLDDRVDGAVILAGVPRFADWYLRYWNPVPSAERPAYSATMATVDPVTFLPETAMPLLFQFAKSDQFVNQAAIDTWLSAAPVERTTVKSYAWNHSLHTEAAVTDRRAFLARVLGLPE